MLLDLFWWRTKFGGIPRRRRGTVQVRIDVDADDEEIAEILAIIMPIAQENP